MGLWNGVFTARIMLCTEVVPSVWWDRAAFRFAKECSICCGFLLGKPREPETRGSGADARSLRLLTDVDHDIESLAAHVCVLDVPTPSTCYSQDILCLYEAGRWQILQLRKDSPNNQQEDRCFGQRECRGATLVKRSGGFVRLTRTIRKRCETIYRYTFARCQLHSAPPVGEPARSQASPVFLAAPTSAQHGSTGSHHF